MKSENSITLLIEDRFVKVTADVVRNYFLDQNLPISSQSEKLLAAQELIGGFIDHHRNDFPGRRNEFILTTLSYEQELLARNEVVPTDIAERIVQEKVRRQEIDLNPDKIIINFNPEIDGMGYVYMDASFASRYPDIESFKKDIQNQLPSRFPFDVTGPQRARYDATLQESWKIGKQGIFELAKKLEGYHYHLDGRKYNAEIKLINLQVPASPSSRGVNRVLTLLFGRFTDL